MTDEEIIQSLKLKIEDHEAFVIKYKGALSILQGGSEKPVIKEPSKLTKQYPLAGTFQNNIEAILDEASFSKTAKELRQKYHETTGKDLNTPSFSGQLSGLVRKGVLKVIKFPERPIDERFEYALTKWFDGDILSEEHKKSPTNTGLNDIQSTG